MNRFERRYVTPDIRLEGDDEKTIEGYSIVYNEWTDIGGWFREQIAPGAVDESIENDDVRALTNHDPSLLLGRTGNETLALMSDPDKGLHMTARPNMETGAGKDTVAWIERGDITGQSFGFRVMKDEWETKEINGTPIEHRTILKVKLYDVGPVTFPAYQQTNIAARSSQEIWERRCELRGDEPGEIENTAESGTICDGTCRHLHDRGEDLRSEEDPSGNPEGGSGEAQGRITMTQLKRRRIYLRQHQPEAKA